MPFLDPEIYGRSTLENSSFLASSLNPNEAFHGRGFVARLSGSTAEFLSMWRRMFFGEQLFSLRDGKLSFTFSPAIHAYLIPEDRAVSAMLLGSCRVTYRLAQRTDVIPGKYEIRELHCTMKDGRQMTLAGGRLGALAAENLRAGRMASIEVFIDN